MLSTPKQGIAQAILPKGKRAKRMPPQRPAMQRGRAGVEILLHIPGPTERGSDFNGGRAAPSIPAMPSLGPTFATMEHDEARDRMRKALDLVHSWPAVYMFKFIFEPEQERLDALLALFPEEAEVLRKYSKAGKYLSLTIREVMMSADEVVARYDKASKVEGVIVL